MPAVRPYMLPGPRPSAPWLVDASIPHARAVQITRAEPDVRRDLLLRHALTAIFYNDGSASLHPARYCNIGRHGTRAAQG